MNLVIVESASKAKTIQKYLNTSPLLSHLGSFEVVASLGHVLDIPSKGMGIDLATWEVSYEPTASRKSIIKKILSLAKPARCVYIASDPDREGEAIAHHIRNLITKLSSNARIERVAFHEITQGAVVEAILHPRAFDNNLIDAQEARRALDRVVGYEASPLLWKRFSVCKLSAGRVQSAALKMIIDRFSAHESHSYNKEWYLEGKFSLEGWDDVLEANLVKSVKDMARITWTDEAKVDECIRSFPNGGEGGVWAIDISQKDVCRRPPAPLTTSTLQQEVYTRHRIPIAQTMRIAQTLYEAGLITYMRTDSMNLSKDAKQKIGAWVQHEFDSSHVHFRTYKTKVANAQEAHEAIRPTQAGLLFTGLDESHEKVYSIIRKRAIASQMRDAQYLQIHYIISNRGSQYVFSGTHDVLIEPGFLKVLQPDVRTDIDGRKKIQGLVDVSKRNDNDNGVVAVCPRNMTWVGDVVRPRPLFQEQSLVKALEKEGIGRPSTYSSTLKKLFDRSYVSKGSVPARNETVRHHKMEIGESGASVIVEIVEEEIILGGKDNNLLIPSSLGHRIGQYLDESVPLVTNHSFTAQMEESLDQVSRGEVGKVEMLTEFYKVFHPYIENALVSRQKARECEGVGVVGKAVVTRESELPLRCFEKQDTNLIKTKYGPALFNKGTKTYYSLTSFLQWKNKSIDEFTEEDCDFLLTTPIATGIEGVSIEIGRYGLYIKHKNKNIRLPSEYWDRVYDGTWSKEEIQDCIHGNANANTCKPTRAKRMSKKKGTTNKLK